MTKNVVSMANLNGGLALTAGEAHKLILLLRCGQRHSTISSRTDNLVDRVCNILTGHRPGDKNRLTATERQTLANQAANNLLSALDEADRQGKICVSLTGLNNDDR